MMSIPSSSAWAALALVGDHLWQSTLVAVVAALLTLASKRNRADVRAWIWLVALVKFLVPFGALIAIGRQLSWRAPTNVNVQPVTTFLFDTLGQPFSQPLSVPPPAAPAATTSSVVAAAAPVVLLAIWAGGMALILAVWWVRWRRVAAIVQSAPRIDRGRDLDALRHLERTAGIARPMAMVASHTTLEPGVFGIMRPALLWSRGIGEHLSDVQVEAVLAHEVCHVRRRDNLLAALQMFVEALFWFHPLVWWLGARLVEERERACDEDVLALGTDPQVYAEGIVKICEFYVESPLVCVAGVTGSDLKKRIEAIMSDQLGDSLSTWRKLLLTTMAVLLLSGPVFVGTLDALPLRAQSSSVDEQPPAIEAASIKLNTSGDERVAGGFQPGGRYRVTNYTLRALIAAAYVRPQVNPDFLIAGGPKWIDTDHFDVEVKASGDLLASGAAPESARSPRRVMLQALLADRFKLRVHRETSERPVYALVLARKDQRLGPQLRPAAVDCAALGVSPNSGPAPASSSRERASCGMSVGPGRIAASAVTVAQLTNLLPRFLNRVVVDQTGLVGGFDMDLTWTPAPGEWIAPPLPGGTPPSADGPSIFTAMQEQLGLKLESTKGSVDVLVIDRAEPPTDNQTGAVNPRPPTPSRWLSDETDHFDVFYSASAAAEIDRVKRDVERAYNTVSAERRHDIPSRPVLLVFASRAQMEQSSAVDQIIASGVTLPPPSARVLLAVDMSLEQRSAELLRQLRAIFERDIAAALAPRAQAPSIAPRGGSAAFDVASVKANRSGDRRAVVSQAQSGGRYTATNVPLDVLISIAYQPLQRYELDGVPDWARSERFDVEAKADANAAPAETWLMLRSLLADRFKLAVHREMREQPVFALVLAKPGQLGSQLRPHTNDARCVDVSTAAAQPGGIPDSGKPLPTPPCGAWSGAPALGRMAGQRVSLDTFGRAVSGQLGRMVLDRTGLNGAFDLTLEWTPQLPPAASQAIAERNAGAPPDGPSIFTAVQEQLGLKLESTRGLVDVLVIDGLERPTPD